MQINLELGKRLNPEAWPWETPEEMFTELLKPTGYTYEELREEAPVYLPVEYYKYKTGRMRSDGQPGFQTATGRIELWSTSVSYTHLSIHTVTAFLIAGLPGRAYWLTAIMAARFLASAFAAGPALLIVICFIMRKFTTFKASDKAIDTLAKIVCYAMIANVFFFVLEIFTAFYSNIPSHMASLEYLFFGLDGSGQLVPFMWTAVVLAFVGLFLLLVPKLRRNHKTLIVGLVAVFFACWIDKGLGLILAGFVPNSFEQVVDYIPNLNEILVIVGVYGIGFLVLTVLYKVAVNVHEHGIAFAHSKDREIAEGADAADAAE